MHCQVPYVARYTGMHHSPISWRNWTQCSYVPGMWSPWHADCDPQVRDQRQPNTHMLCSSCIADYMYVNTGMICMPYDCMTQHTMSQVMSHNNTLDFNQFQYVEKYQWTVPNGRNAVCQKACARHSELYRCICICTNLESQTGQNSCLSNAGCPLLTLAATG